MFKNAIIIIIIIIIIKDIKCLTKARRVLETSNSKTLFVNLFIVSTVGQFLL